MQVSAAVVEVIDMAAVGQDGADAVAHPTSGLEVSCGLLLAESFVRCYGLLVVLDHDVVTVGDTTQMFAVAVINVSEKLNC